MKKTNKTLGIFGNLYAMVFAALLVAISVTGKVYAINIGTELRISYENLPVILSGIMMGPAVGIVVGVCADLCGCLVMGYSVNPIITLGMASLGLTSGIISMFFKNRFSPVSLIVCDISAHIIGNIILKTIDNRLSSINVKNAEIPKVINAYKYFCNEHQTLCLYLLLYQFY